MIERWDIITIGNLSRNRYWGESDDRAYRPALCTSTLLQGPGLCLLVDAPLADPHAMEAELNRRTGLTLSEVRDVFLTHEHGDHVAGLAALACAACWAGDPVARSLNATGRLPKLVRPASDAPWRDRIDVVATPGHTRDHCSLRFDRGNASVVIAGDAVMTRDFWEGRQGFHNSADFGQVARTMDRLASMADIIVPGHDNYFPTQRG